MRSLIPRAAAARAAAFADGRGLPGSILRGLTALLLAVGLAGTGVAGAGPAGASTTAAAARAGQCTRTVTGTHHGILVAGRGVLCLDHATQSGPVRVWPGAGLKVTASVISGAVTAARARFASVCGSTIIGPVRIDGVAGPVTAGRSGASCRGDAVHGRLVIIGSAGPVRVAGLRAQGPVVLSGNVGGVRLSGASVAGTVTVRGNRGPVVVSGDVISGSLACAGNRPGPADAGRPDTVAGTAGGQCSGLVPRPPRRSLTPLDQDLSATLPNLNLGQAVGDFTGVGHDELAYYRSDSETSGQLVISNVAEYGGGTVRSAPNNNLLFEPSWLGGVPFTGFEASPKVAASSSNLYLAGNTTSDLPYTFSGVLYKLPHDGSCAEASCALKTVDLPDDAWVESMTVGTVGGRTLIAVALGAGDIGEIAIYDDDLNLVTTFPVEGHTSVSPVIAMAFGPPSGPGQGSWLAAGLDPLEGMQASTQSADGWVLNPDGTEQTSWGKIWGGTDAGVTFAHVGGQLAAVFTRSDGDVIAVDADTGDMITDLPGAQRTGTPLGITAVTPVGGDPTNQDLVVGMQDGTGDKVLQDVDGQWAGVPFVPGGAVTGTADEVYAWWPGYVAGRLRVANNSAGPVDIAMASRPDPGYGCWLDTSVTQPPVSAFPVADTRVAAGAVSPDYFAGALTAGPDVSCASAQPGSTGERASYVIITPAGDRADEHVVKLVAGASDGALRIDSQVGGYLTAAVSRVSSAPGTWGTWQLTVTGGSAPQASSAPAVTGFRLTAAPDPANYQPPTSPAADDPCRPVYRFDVTGAQWKSVISPGLQTAQLPAMTAQGSSDGGKTWTDLGQLMPATAPAVAADGTVTLGPASFFFQNKPGTATVPGVWTAGQPSTCPATGDSPVTEVRAMSGGLASAPVNLAGLAAPPLDTAYATQVNGAAAIPDGDGSAAATPRADGVDQAGLTLQLSPSGGGSIDPSDPRYGLVYYRDDVTKALVTGLYQPGGYASYTAVGRYAADGSAGQSNRIWLVTTSTAVQHLDPVMNDSGTVTANTTNNGSSFEVAAGSTPLTVGGTATGGISITGCTGSPTATCTLTVPASTAPALYQAGPDQNGDPVTGLLLPPVAITGRASLPLQVGTANVHNLGSAPLVVTASQAKLTDTSQFFPSDTVDTALVTAGQLVPALSIPVGNGG